MGGRAQLLAGILGLAALGAAGCKEYKYLDIHVRFDGSVFMVAEVRQVQSCHVTVTGADNDSFDIVENCSFESQPPGTDIGTFEYSTHAESGSLTFTLEAYNGQTQTPDCLLGRGTKTYMLTGETTQLDDPGPDDDLVVNERVGGCL